MPRALPVMTMTRDSVTPGALRKGLSRLVPSYMIPSRWQAFESLPKTANNKIDRKILRAEFSKTDVKEKA